MQDFIMRASPWAITLVRHDWPLFVGIVATLCSVVRLFVRPSRRAALFLYGWLTLVFAFEYTKNGLVESLETTNYLFSSYANPDLRDLSQTIFRDALPPALYTAGVLMLIIAIAPTPGNRNGRKAQLVRPNEPAETAADVRKTI
jgi:hypothetical protein